MNDYGMFHRYTSKQLDAEFLDACEKNEIDKVEYLLTSPNLAEKANIHTFNDLATNLVCSKNHVELMKFLVSSPKLKDHIDINAHEEKLFTTAFVYKREEIIAYLIFECGIEKNEIINEFFSTMDNPPAHPANCQKEFKSVVEKMFAKRELQEILKNELSVNDKKNKLNKL